jgi:hypothetical protein
MLGHIDYKATDWVEYKSPEVKNKPQWLDKLPEEEGYYQGWKDRYTVVLFDGKLFHMLKEGTLHPLDPTLRGYKWLPLELAPPPEEKDE